MRKILEWHYKKYPLMKPQDAVKLCFQKTFGGGHMIPDPAIALERLKDEMAKTVPDGRPLLEDIGGRYRLYLNSQGCSSLHPETINALFCATANGKVGTRNAFMEDLQVLKETADDGIAPFTRAELDAYLQEYIAYGCRAVSHTDCYRTAYSPAYRLVPVQTQYLLPLFKAIDRLLAEKGAAVIAIDGMCGSGKSTLGAWLSGIYNAQLIHMDDYFLPFPRKTTERLSEPGGNVDYERVEEELKHVPAGSAVSFRRYDCGTGTLGEWQQLEAAPLRIIEGSYSLHPTLASMYDLKVYISVDPLLQLDRILKRNGPEKLIRFKNEWIPMENYYDSELQIRGKCDLILDGALLHMEAER